MHDKCASHYIYLSSFFANMVYFFLVLLIRRRPLESSSQGGNVLLASAKPRLAHQSAKQRWFVTPQNRLLLQSPAVLVTCFTPIHLILAVVFSDERLACSCSATETHSMKLLPHNFFMLILRPMAFVTLRQSAEHGDTRSCCFPLIPFTVDLGISGRWQFPHWMLLCIHKTP